MNNYEQQAADFLKSTNTTIEKVFNRLDFYFTDDKEKGNIWDITIKNEN